VAATDRASNEGTATFTVTPDADPPVVAVEAIVNGSAIDVTWSGDDPSAGSGQAGSGVSHYDVDVKVDDEPWTAWLVETTDTSDTYDGEPGHRYAFRVTATDNVGNVGEGEAETRVAAVTKYYYFGARRVAMRGPDGVYYLHTDHLGSTSLTTDEGGAVVARQLYHPFGTVRWSEGTLPTDFGFTGQRHDGTGLIFMHARYYHPLVGRFISADTIVPSPGNPQDFNRYSYVRNNPLIYTDPSGHGLKEDLEKLVGKVVDWAGDRISDALVLPWRLIPGDFCLGSLGCWGGEEYADWLQNEVHPNLGEDLYWTWYHPAQAWGLPGDSLKTMMVENWFFELGESDNVYFDGSHPTTQVLKRHKGVREALDKFYRNGCGITEYQYDAAKGKEGWAVVPIAASAHLRVFAEIVFQIPDSEATIEGAIGSYNMMIGNNGNGTATFWIWNTTSWESGTFGLIGNQTRDATGPNWLSENGLGGNLTQNFLWDEPIDLSLCVDQGSP
jgi:RHS repeat-associated protein